MVTKRDWRDRNSGKRYSNFVLGFILSISPVTKFGHSCATNAHCSVNILGLNKMVDTLLTALVKSLLTQALVQIMLCCSQARSHYVNQFWPRIVATYGVIRPRWVIHTWYLLIHFHDISLYAHTRSKVEEESGLFLRLNENYFPYSGVMYNNLTKSLEFDIRCTLLIFWPFLIISLSQVRYELVNTFLVYIICIHFAQMICNLALDSVK